MKRLAVLGLLMGCATQPNFNTAVRLDAFGPDGDVRSTPTEQYTASAEARGVIIEYRTGDTVKLHVHLDSNIAHTAEVAPIELTLQQPLWVYSGPGGIWLSTDGVAFRPWREAVSGGLGFGIGLDGGAQRNVVNVSLKGILQR